MKENSRFYASAGLVLLVLAAIMLASGLLLHALSKQTSQDDTGLTVALIAVISFCAILMVLTLIIIVFALYGFSDKTQALALPDGSIRAIITILLLVAFLTIPLYLFQEFSGDTQTVDHLTTAQKTALLSSLPLRSVSEIRDDTPSWSVAYTAPAPAPPAGAPAPSPVPTPPQTRPLSKLTESEKNDLLKDFPAGVATNKPPAEADQIWSVTYVNSDPTRQDFAKTLYATISTLLITIVGFYFGAGVTRTALNTGVSPNPTLKSVDPPQYSGGNVPFTITGSGLDLAQTVKLVSGSTEIPATSVLSNPTQITCNFNADPTLQAGAWDLVVTTSDGKSARLPGAVTVPTAGTPLPAPVTAPIVTTIAPPTGSTAGGTPVTITGTGLTGVTAVSFGPNPATAFTPVSDTQVTATSPAGAAGPVSVTVTTPAGPSAASPATQFTYD